MALLAQAGTFTSPAATGLQTVSLDNGIWGGASPKVVLIWGSHGESDGVTAEAVIHFGVAVSSTSRAAIHANSRNGFATSSADRRHTNAAVISTLDGLGAVFEEADLDSFNADNFKLDWTKVHSSARINNFLALGGDDLENVHLNQIQSPTSTGNQSYTGVGFQPDAMLAFWIAHQTAPPDTTTTALLSVGYSDSEKDVCVNASSQDGLATSNTARHQIAALLANPNLGTLSIANSASVASLDLDGYTLNWDTVDGTARHAWILALKGPQFKVLTDTQPTTNTTKSTAVGFVPRASLFSTFMGPAAATVQDHARIGIGGWDYSDNQAFAGAVDEDGQGTTDADRIQDSNEALKMIDHAQTVVGSAAASANGNNLDMVWTDTDGTEREWGALVMGDKAATGEVLTKPLRPTIFSKLTWSPTWSPTNNRRS